MLSFAPVLALLVACSDGPLFSNIQGIDVQVVSPNGLKKHTLEGAALAEGAGCLQGNTKEVDEATTQKRQLLQNTYLLLVRDDSGVRNFEMITDYHMKGNKERYYENRCIYQVLKKHLPQS